MNSAIIVAAGAGKRFAADQPKQFAAILGKPLIFHTLERFQACSVVDEIILVLSAEGRELFGRDRSAYAIDKVSSIVTGGSTRAESVARGLAAIDEETAGVVVVHDGARPLVSVDEISRTIEKATETGAACLVARLTDTIKEVAGDRIAGTIDRDRLRRALTPQAFRYEILKAAFDGVDLTESITDECYLVEKTGVEIALVEGSGRNIKVTHGEDLLLAEMYLRESKA